MQKYYFFTQHDTYISLSSSSRKMIKGFKPADMYRATFVALVDTDNKTIEVLKCVLPIGLHGVYSYNILTNILKAMKEGDGELLGTFNPYSVWKPKTNFELFYEENY